MTQNKEEKNTQGVKKSCWNQNFDSRNEKILEKDKTDEILSVSTDLRGDSNETQMAVGIKRCKQLCVK